MANAIRAQAERWLGAEFCGAIVDHYSCVACADGDLMKGVQSRDDRAH
ncbi:hypothetical protein [Rhodopseudomonas faecalis]|nr:hypothetical protein [Rhodopseudomonas faecalis]